METRSRRTKSLAALSLLLALVTPGCAGSCPTPGSAASVTPTGAPCRGGVAGSSGPAGDPLTLLGGDLLVAMRVDFGAIRQHPLGQAAERVLVGMIRTGAPRESVTAMIETATRTQVLAVGVGDQSLVMVAQGSYTPLDLAFLSSEERSTRRQHVIQHGRRSVGAVVDGRYLVYAERDTIDGVLDRLDGLEDPAPQTVPLQDAIAAVDGYHTYFAAVGVPLGEIRQELRRERGFGAMAADARWAAMSIGPGSAGLELNGRVHTITDAAANVVLEASQDLQIEATAELTREAPPLGAAARVFVLATDGTDATVRWAPTDPEAGDVIEAFRAHFDERAAQRESYEELDDNSTTIAPSP